MYNGIQILPNNLIVQLFRDPIEVLLLSDPNDDEKITAEGMMKFLEDLCLNPESQVVLVLAWKFKAATQCEFTKEEWTTGMTELA